MLTRFRVAVVLRVARAMAHAYGDVTTKAEMGKFRDRTLRLRTRVHDMRGQKKSRGDIAKRLQSEFHFAELHLMFSPDGLMSEVR